MNTKVLTTTTAILIGVTFLTLSFFPQEVSNYLNLAGINPAVMQIFGILYFGFVILSWAAKATLIGGIY